MKDFIIVGFGISGLSLHQAIKNLGMDSVVISDQSQKASLAAGGLLNPVMLNTGKLVWNIDQFLAFAKQFYALFSEDAFIEFPIHRIFNSVVEQNNHLTLVNSFNHQYVSTRLVDSYSGIKAPFKLSQVDSGGVVNIQKILKFVKNQLSLEGTFISSTFDFAHFDIHQDYVEYNGIKAKHIIFAEGFGVASNPFFSNLPIEGNKGEYIIIQSKSLQLNAVLKNKFFLIPLGNDLYKYGATYNRNEFKNTPSVYAREELKLHLDKMLSCDYQIVDQVAGLRPTVKDKKPICGTHSKFSKLHIFNGMGSRGLLMAPLLAKELIEHVINGFPLRKEIHLNRFMNS